MQCSSYGWKFLILETVIGTLLILFIQFIVTFYLILQAFSILNFHSLLNRFLLSCHMQVHSFGKLHPCSDITPKTYKPTFHGSHFSCNMSYGGAATLRVFRLPQWRYSYSTQSFMTELLLSVSQHWNLRSG